MHAAFPHCITTLTRCIRDCTQLSCCSRDALSKIPKKASASSSGAPRVLRQLARNVIAQTRTNTSMTLDFLHYWQHNPDLALHNSGNWRLKCRSRWSPTRGNDSWPTVKPLDHLDASSRLGTMKAVPTMQAHLLTPMPCWSSLWRHYVACENLSNYDKIARVSWILFMYIFANLT